MRPLFHRRAIIYGIEALLLENKSLNIFQNISYLSVLLWLPVQIFRKPMLHYVLRCSLDQWKGVVQKRGIDVRAVFCDPRNGEGLFAVAHISYLRHGVRQEIVRPLQAGAGDHFSSRSPESHFYCFAARLLRLFQIRG